MSVRALPAVTGAILDLVARYAAKGALTAEQAGLLTTLANRIIASLSLSWTGSSRATIRLDREGCPALRAPRR